MHSEIKKAAFVKRHKASLFVPTFSREFKASYKHLNLTKHASMSFIAASGKQRTQPGGCPGDQTVIKSICKDFQWSRQSHSTLHVFPRCVAHGRSIKLIHSWLQPGSFRTRAEMSLLRSPRLRTRRSRVGSPGAGSSRVGWRSRRGQDPGRPDAGWEGGDWWRWGGGRLEIPTNCVAINLIWDWN